MIIEKKISLNDKNKNISDNEEDESEDNTSKMLVMTI